MFFKESGMVLQWLAICALAVSLNNIGRAWKMFKAPSFGLGCCAITQGFCWMLMLAYVHPEEENGAKCLYWFYFMMNNIIWTCIWAFYLVACSNAKINGCAKCLGLSAGAIGILITVVKFFFWTIFIWRKAENRDLWYLQFMFFWLWDLFTRLSGVFLLLIQIGAIVCSGPQDTHGFHMQMKTAESQPMMVD